MTAPGTVPIRATGWWVKRSIKAFPTEVALTLTGSAPTIRSGAWVAPTAASLTITGQVPTII